MKNVRIHFDGTEPIALPDGTCLGVVGEHNAVKLVITLPDSMVDGIDYHVVTLGGVVSARITTEPNIDGAYRDGNTIYQPLTAYYTTERIVDLSVTAYKQNGDTVEVIDKTPTVYGLRFGDGQPKQIVGGMVAEVAALTHAVDTLEEEVDTLKDDVPSSSDIQKWDAAAEDAHTHENGEALAKLTESNGMLLCDGKVVGIEVVTTLPNNADNGKIVFLNSSSEDHKGFYISTENTWVRLTDGHSHGNKSALDRITGTGDAVDYNGKTVVLADKDNFTQLELDTEYETLVFRNNIEDVPVTYGQYDLIGMPAYDAIGEYQYASMRLEILDAFGKGVHIYDKIFGSGGLGLYGIVVTTDAEVTADGEIGVYGTDLNGVSGWKTIDEQGHVVGNVLSNFTPVCYSFNGMQVDPSSMSHEQLAAIRYISQIVNVSADAMGTIHDDPDTVLRYMKKLNPNRKYWYDIQQDWYDAGYQDALFYLPEESDMISANDDAQIVFYIRTDFDADMTFDWINGSNFLYVGGKIPDTPTGLYKFIFTWLPDVKNWLIGCIDYAEVT